MNSRFVIFMLGLTSILLTCCSKEQPTQIQAFDYGLYESSTFIEPGPRDAGIDIQASGGVLRINFQETNDFTADLSIPDSLFCTYPKGNTSYSGKYAVYADSIAFSDDSFIVRAVRWDKQSKTLESYDVPPRGRPFKIVLFKRS